LLTQDDLLRGLRDQPAASVGEVMHDQFPVARAGESVAAAQGQLGEAGVRALPVVRPDGRLAGLLTTADIGEAYRLLTAQSQQVRGSGAPRVAD
jgi:CBS domain-containing protein